MFGLWLKRGLDVKVAWLLVFVGDADAVGVVEVLWSKPTAGFGTLEIA